MHVDLHVVVDIILSIYHDIYKSTFFPRVKPKPFAMIW